ncbi:hypothetical protein KGF56_003495 [Candida oxycetoniae]|uniref:Cullin family profile domain-containing protein n=1 Tax=Candida oxycetoniae TaxID=497107 RepID=A0AAI9SVF4_9ASCO|nr:uncharacterized protein KGF56_003495 [Candida oxycetoniae]KAI3403677.2 hypothetical protein KGF56_003495 [Candida oxycetoniae]
MPKAIAQVLDLGSVSGTPPGERTFSHLVTSSSSLEKKNSRGQYKNNGTELMKRKRPLESGEIGGGVDVCTTERVERLLRETKSILYTVMDRIIEGRSLGYSTAHIHRLVENVCRYKHAEMRELADVIFEKLEQYLKGIINETLLGGESKDLFKMNNSSNEMVVKRATNVLKSWNLWYNAFSKMSKVFSFIDGKYLLSHYSKKQLVEFGYSSFAKRFFFDIYCNVHMPLVSIYYLDMDKQGSEQDKKRLKQLYQDITTIMTDLEPFMEAQSENQEVELCDFSEVVLESIISANDALKSKDDSSRGVSVQKLFKIMDDECRFYAACHKSDDFVKSLLRDMKFRMLFQDFQSVVTPSFADLLESPREMQLLWKYCLEVKETHGLDAVAFLLFEWKNYCVSVLTDSFKKYCAGGGGDGGGSSNSSSSLVSTDEYPSIIFYAQRVFATLDHQREQNLNGNDQFKSKLKSALEEVVNSEEYNLYTIQQLCKFCDTYFKSMFKAYPRIACSVSFHEIKSHVILFFKALKNKQDFLSAYKKEVSRRLLLGRSVRIEEEHQLAKELVGLALETETASGLLAMFGDLETSKSIKEGFNESGGIEFTPLVLEKQVWLDIPNEKHDHIKMPKELQDLLNRFELHYQEKDSKYKNREIDWSNYKLHQLTIAGQFSKGEVLISANLLQATILVLFTEKPTYSLSQLERETGMDLKLLQSVLNTMNQGKTKILDQIGNTVHYNSDFRALSSSKVKLPPIKESAKIGSFSLDAKDNIHNIIEKEVNQIVDHNRSEEYEGVIVKIMKAQKSLTVTDLLNRSMVILEKRRPVTIIALKACLETLIDREYIKRNGTEIVEYIP